MEIAKPNSILIFLISDFKEIADQIDLNRKRLAVNCQLISSRPPDCHLIGYKTFIINGLQKFVELEGLEPSSKRGSNLLSTCLASF